MQNRSSVFCFFPLALCVLLVGCLPASLFAQGFLELFDYDPGDLTNVSDGVWVNHAGEGKDIQIESCRCQISSVSSRANNRSIGKILQSNETWYYALEFSVQTEISINVDYFMHLKDNTNFGFNACLQVEPPIDAADDYGLSILANGQESSFTRWPEDFAHGDILSAVVRWKNDAGEATLWINPTLAANSEEDAPHVTHVDSGSAMRAIESLALQQSLSFVGNTTVTVNKMATGPDFEGTLAGISFEPFFAPGDVNQDCRINLLDVEPFVDVLVSGEYDPLADINFDGDVNLLDVPLFVLLLTGAGNQ